MKRRYSRRGAGSLGACCDETGTALFLDWTCCMFLTYCVACGCDYVKNLAGIGRVTVREVVEFQRTPERVLTELLRRRRGNFPSDAEYSVAFWRARALFRHMRVYDPRSRKIVYLRPCSPADATLIRARLSCDPDAILGQVDGARADDDDDAHDDAHDDHDDPRSIAPNTSTKRAAQPTEYESPRRPRLRL